MPEHPSAPPEAAVEAMVDHFESATGALSDVARLSAYPEMRELLAAALLAIHADLRERLLSDEAVRAGAIQGLPEAFPGGPPKPGEEPDWLEEDVEWGEAVARAMLRAALDSIGLNEGEQR